MQLSSLSPANCFRSSISVYKRNILDESKEFHASQFLTSTATGERRTSLDYDKTLCVNENIILPCDFVVERLLSHLLHRGVQHLEIQCVYEQHQSERRVQFIASFSLGSSGSLSGQPLMDLQQCVCSTRDCPRRGKTRTHDNGNRILISCM